MFLLHLVAEDNGHAYSLLKEFRTLTEAKEAVESEGRIFDVLNYVILEPLKDDDLINSTLETG